MKIRVLGCHHTETESARLSSLLMDDQIALDAGALTSTLSLEEQAKINSVIITHHHFDHVRDLLTLALGGYHTGETISVYSTPEVLEFLGDNFLNGRLYPDFTTRPTPPRLRLVPIESGRSHQVAHIEVTPLDVDHSVPAIGIFIKGKGGESLFCTGDTGGGFAGTLERFRPSTLITEVTFPNAEEALARMTKHMTPKLLEDELLLLAGTGSLPQSVLAIHMSPETEDQIREELAGVGEKLSIPITPAYEGMVPEL